MTRIKVMKLIDDYGVKKQKIIEILGTNKVTFSKKMRDNSFTDSDVIKIKAVYKELF